MMTLKQNFVSAALSRYFDEYIICFQRHVIWGIRNFVISLKYVQQLFQKYKINAIWLAFTTLGENRYIFIIFYW